jgi:hypothetical protein
LVDQLPRIFVAALRAPMALARAAIKAEQHASTRKNVVKILQQIRSTGEFDEADSLQVGLLEPNFSDRYTRTPQRVRKNADRLLKNYRQERPGKHGRGSGRYFVRTDTLCAYDQHQIWLARRNQSASARGVRETMGGGRRRRSTARRHMPSQ